MTGHDPESEAGYRVIYPPRRKGPVVAGWLAALTIIGAVIALWLVWYARQYCSLDMCPRNEDPPFVVTVAMSLVVVVPISAAIGWIVYRVARATYRPPRPEIRGEASD